MGGSTSIGVYLLTQYIRKIGIDTEKISMAPCARMTRKIVKRFRILIGRNSWGARCRISETKTLQGGCQWHGCDTLSGGSSGSGVKANQTRQPRLPDSAARSRTCEASGFADNILLATCDTFLDTADVACSRI